MRRYRISDFALFSLFLCLLEALSAWALGFFPGESYTFSLTLFVTLLMTVRWGAGGIFFALLGGLVYGFVHGAEPAQILVYALGNSFFALNLLWLKPLGTERLRASAALSSLYCLGGYLSMCLGRALVSLVLGQGFWLVRFLAVDAFGAVISIVLVQIARKQNGLFESQEAYILRVKRDEEEQKHG